MIVLWFRGKVIDFLIEKSLYCNYEMTGVHRPEYKNVRKYRRILWETMA